MLDEIEKNGIRLRDGIIANGDGVVLGKLDYTKLAQKLEAPIIGINSMLLHKVGSHFRNSDYHKDPDEGNKCTYQERKTYRA